MKIYNSVLTITLCFLIIWSNPIVAQPKLVYTNKYKTDCNFKENKGQLSNLDGTINSEIKFYSNNGGVNVYCKPGMVSLLFIKITDTTLKATNLNTRFSKEEVSNKSSVTTNRADMILVGANRNAEIIASEQQEYFENHYNGFTPEQGITNVHTFKTITYKNIYPEIDLILHSQNQGVKYEFLVRPGGNIGDIELKWEGLKNITTLANGGVRYSNSLGSFEDTKPISFQDEKEIESHFNLDGTTLKFSVKEYDKNKALLIDPTVIWATYYGGSNGEFPTSIKTDDSGNVFVIGRTNSTSGISTSGSFQSSFGGNMDIFMVKFNGNGSRQWATYYGGSDYEDAGSVTFEKSGNLYLCGLSLSSSGISTSGAYQTTLASYHYDGVLAKFNRNGGRIWGTYYGGSETEYFYEASVDGSNNVYVSGTSNSSSNIASSGAYQASKGGKYDGILVKFDSSGSRQWATYFGGSEGEDLLVAVDKYDNAFVAGYTVSSSGIATSGAYQTTYGGNVDVVLAKFNSNGTINWATYYGGAQEESGVGKIAINDSGYIYITGRTKSTSSIASKGAYQESLSGSYDAFLAKFSNDGKFILGTYYGGSKDDVGLGLALDSVQNIYLSGNTYSTSGISRPGAYQKYNAGRQDLFLVQFTRNGTRNWASYYGGSNDEALGIIACDKSQNIYLLTQTNSVSGLSTSGAYQTTYSGNKDVFVAKFRFKPFMNDAGLESIKYPKDTICSSLFEVIPKIKNWGINTIDSLMIGWSINNAVQTPYKWKGKLKPDSTMDLNIGNYMLPNGNNKIVVWVYKPNGQSDSILINDTSTIFLYCLPLPNTKAGTNSAICLGKLVGIGMIPISGNKYSWTSIPSGFSSSQSKSAVSPKVSTTYYLTQTIIATGCSQTDSVKITVNPIPIANAGTDTSICYGQSISIGDTTSNGNSYSWASIPYGFSSTISNPTVSPLLNTTYILTTSEIATGCSSSDSILITILPSPPAFAGNDTSICLGTDLKIGSNPISGNTYSWVSIPSGFSSVSSNPTVKPDSNTIYILSEMITFTGCKKTDSVIIKTNPLPLAYAGSDTSVCDGDSIILGSSEIVGNIYSWISNPSGFTSTSSYPKVAPNQTSAYILNETIFNTKCFKTDTVIVKVNPLPLVKVGSDTSICKGDSIIIGSIAENGNSYSWNSLPIGFNSSLSTIKVSPIASTIFRLTQTISATGCKNTDSIKIDVLPLPISHWKAVANGKSISFFAIDTALSPLVYNWNLGDGNSAKGYNVKHVYAKNGSYNIKLIVTGKSACSDEFDSTINVIVSGLKLIQKAIQKFNVYPNPSSNLITIESEYTLINYPYIMTDQTGRQILEGELNAKINTVDISGLASGFYFIQIGEAYKQTYKIFKQ